MVTSGPDRLPNPDKAVAPEPSTAAARALAEAQERRAAAASVQPSPEETGGRGGLEPVRFGDWEVNGLASDF